MNADSSTFSLRIFDSLNYPQGYEIQLNKESTQFVEKKITPI